jgi:hypothetical protein
MTIIAWSMESPWRFYLADLRGCQPQCTLVREPLSHWGVVYRATNELDTTQLPPHEMLEGYKGQVHVEHWFREERSPASRGWRSSGKARME